MTAGAGRGTMGLESVRGYYHLDGVTRKSVYDEDMPGKVRIFTEVDMEGVLESVKRTREERQVAKSDNKLVARVPLTVMEQSIHEQWDEADWKRWLNDPDNAAFRIWQGRV